MARLYLWATYRLYNEFAWAYDVVSWLVSLGQWSAPSPYILDPATLQEVARVLRDPDQASKRPGGRLVIAGLFVETDCEVLQRLVLFFFGSPSEEFIRIYRRIAAEAGFALRIVSQATRSFRSPVFILELEPEVLDGVKTI